MWLILGGHGQLGQCFQLVLPQCNIDYLALGSADIDVTDADAVAKVVSRHSPSVIVNCAAWTAVDAAEDNEDAAFAINEHGARNVARAAKSVGAKYVYVSTDYVFSGTASAPYDEDSPTAPRSVYGRSKLAGEIAVRETYGESSYIVRTAWLYSQFGGNFVKTMTRKALAHETVRVVADQLGQPTYAIDLAQHIVDIVTSGARPGTYHGTNSGITNWCDLTRVIFECLGADPSQVTPINTSDYPTMAERPKYSVLGHRNTHSAGVTYMRSWDDALREALPIIQATVE